MSPVQRPRSSATTARRKLAPHHRTASGPTARPRAPGHWAQHVSATTRERASAVPSTPTPTRPALQVRAHKAGCMRQRTAVPRTEQHQMSVFTVDLKNQPGELARLREAMAGGGINLVLLATARVEEGTGGVHRRRRGQRRRRCSSMQTPGPMRPALTIRMENQPGVGAATFRELADVGVNVDLLLPVRVSDDLFFAVSCVDDADKTRRELGAQVTAWVLRAVGHAVRSVRRARTQRGRRRTPPWPAGSQHTRSPARPAHS